MKYIQLLTHEIGTECNLAKEHTDKCPITIKERYDMVDTSYILSDSDIVNNIVKAYELGFVGATSWHSYCEPLLYMGRIENIIDQVNYNIHDAKHLLWTNGTLINTIVDAKRLKIFDKIIISNYTKRNWDFLKDIVEDVKVLRGHLDSRLSKGRFTRKRCFRLYYEMIIDYYGNYRVCCGDFMGKSVSINVKNHGFEAAVAEHIRLRSLIQEEPQVDVPSICNNCRILGRNEIYQLVDHPYFETEKMLLDSKIIIKSSEGKLYT